eukprot:tig00021179_g19297.t1
MTTGPLWPRPAAALCTSADAAARACPDRQARSLAGEAIEGAERLLAGGSGPGGAEADAVPLPGMDPLAGSAAGRAALRSLAAGARRFVVAAGSLFALGHLAEAELLAARGPSRRPSGRARTPEEEERSAARRCASSLLSIYTHIMVHKGDGLAAVYYAARNAVIAGEEPETPGYVDACAFMYSIFTLMKLRSRAEAFRRRAQELLKSPRCAGALGYLLSNEVSTLAMLGKLREAEELSARGAIEARPAPAPPPPRPAPPAPSTAPAAQLASGGTCAPPSRRRSTTRLWRPSAAASPPPSTPARPSSKKRAWRATRWRRAA